MFFCIPCYNISDKIARLEKEVEHLQQGNDNLQAKVAITEQSIQLCHHHIEQCEARITLLQEQSQKCNVNSENIIEAIIPQTKTISVLGSYLYQWMHKDKT